MENIESFASANQKEVTKNDPASPEALKEYIREKLEDPKSAYFSDMDNKPNEEVIEQTANEFFDVWRELKEGTISEGDYNQWKQLKKEELAPKTYEAGIVDLLNGVATYELYKYDVDNKNSQD